MHRRRLYFVITPSLSMAASEDSISLLTTSVLHTCRKQNTVFVGRNQRVVSQSEKRTSNCLVYSAHITDQPKHRLATQTVPAKPGRVQLIKTAEENPTQYLKCTTKCRQRKPCGYNTFMGTPASASSKLETWRRALSSMPRSPVASNACDGTWRAIFELNFKTHVFDKML